MLGKHLTPEKFLESKVNQFFKAVQQNRLDDVKAILEEVEGAEIPSLEGKCVVNHLIQKKSGDTGIHVCASHGFLELMQYLVEEKNANLEQVNLDGKTALHDAAQFSRFEVAKYLLIRGANINVVKRADWTPLMLACTKQDVSLIKLLLEFKADPFFVNKDGWNCCHIASREGNADIVKLLLNLQPEARRKLTQWKSKNGRKPLHTAVMHGHLEVCKLLVEASNIEEINEEDHCGTTAIMEASRFGFIELIEYLITNAQADLNRCNKQGLNCLHLASEAGQSDMIKILVLKYGMSINQQSESLNMTPLHWAAKEGQSKAIMTLLSLGSSTGITDAKGRTAFDVAVAFGHNECASLLKGNGS